ncbi:MAG: TatD family hydrolase [bacterium]|nr:TatD family hydrolase [bacterium]
MNRPEYIDIHSHVNFRDFDGDRHETIKRALDAKVWMINVGTGLDMSKKAIDMTREYPEGVYAIIGLHPIHVEEEKFDASAYCESFAFAPKGKVVGIGECGLDYFHTKDEVGRALQKKVFLEQIDLALKLDLPLMLHVRSGADRDAYDDTLAILTEYKAKAGDKLRGDAHFFAGSVEQAKAFIDLGFHLSFTGVVTFAKQYEALVKAVPNDRIMSETDCPYVAPVPNRGKRCEPIFVREVADKMASIKGEDPVPFRRQLVENANALWKLGF